MPHISSRPALNHQQTKETSVATPKRKRDNKENSSRKRRRSTPKLPTRYPRTNDGISMYPPILPKGILTSSSTPNVYPNAALVPQSHPWVLPSIFGCSIPPVMPPQEQKVVEYFVEEPKSCFPEIGSSLHHFDDNGQIMILAIEEQDEASNITYKTVESDIISSNCSECVPASSLLVLSEEPLHASVAEVSLSGEASGNASVSQASHLGCSNQICEKRDLQVEDILECNCLECLNPTSPSSIDDDDFRKLLEYLEASLGHSISEGLLENSTDLSHSKSANPESEDLEITPPTDPAVTSKPSVRTCSSPEVSIVEEVHEAFHSTGGSPSDPRSKSSGDGQDALSPDSSFDLYMNNLLRILDETTAENELHFQHTEPPRLTPTERELSDASAVDILEDTSDGPIAESIEGTSAKLCFETLSPENCQFFGIGVQSESESKITQLKQSVAVNIDDYVTKRGDILSPMSCLSRNFILIWKIGDESVRPDHVASFLHQGDEGPAYINDWWMASPGCPVQSWTGSVVSFRTPEDAESMLKQVQVSFRDLRAMPLQELIDEIAADEVFCSRVEKDARSVYISSRMPIRTEPDLTELQDLIESIGEVEELHFFRHRRHHSTVEGHQRICEVTYKYMTQAVAAILVLHQRFRENLGRLVVDLSYTAEGARIATSVRQTVVSRYFCDRFPFLGRFRKV